MKIIKKLQKLIEVGDKTIEFRKVAQLKKYLNKYQIDNKGKLIIPLEDSITGESLGKIIINDYKIMENVFLKYNDVYKTKLYLEAYLPNANYLTKFKTTVLAPIFGVENVEWIFNNWDWLFAYYENEKKILVLQIESWEPNETINN